MNIFVLDANPITAARFHNDRHVVKMILESCQLLATAHHVLDGKVPAAVTLRPTHTRHPCALWTMAEPANYEWLHALCGGLFMEYRNRYNKRHAHESVWELLWQPPCVGPAAIQLDQPLCMPEYCKVFHPRVGQRPQVHDPIASYRQYYFKEKKHLATWYQGDESKIPQWWKDMENNNEA
jgi:hypothetical protein